MVAIGGADADGGLLAPGGLRSASALMGFWSVVGGVLGESGRRQRRVWARDGKAYIEVRAVHRPLPVARRVASHVEAALSEFDGVNFAAVIVALGQVAVAFDDSAVGVDELVAIVETVEETHGVEGDLFPLGRPEHPGDIEPLLRAVAAMGADLAGLGLGLLGWALKAVPLPAELAGLVSMVEGDPRARSFLNDRIGVAGTDVALAVTNAVAQGLAQGPLGLVVDVVHRAGQVGEIQARRTSWNARQSGLRLSRPPAGLSTDDRDPARGAPTGERPRPRPKGPVELYAERAAMANIAGPAAAMLATASARRASAVLLASAPKAARLGREAFAAHLGRDLARRGLIVLDSRALRRLDTIDCVCVESDLLTTGRRVLEQVTVLGRSDRAEAESRLRGLYDSRQPTQVHRRERWMAGPVDQLVLDAEARARVLRDRLGRGGHGPSPLIGLARNGRLVAIADAVDELHPLAATLVALAHREGYLVAVAGSDPSLAQRVDADTFIDGGTGLATSVRSLQEDGLSVCLIAGPRPEALRAGDCSLEVPGPTGLVTLSGHLLASTSLQDGCFLVEASGAARQASRQAVALALIGSAVASVAALTGGDDGAARRAMAVVNLAALTSVANGTRAAIMLGRRPDHDSTILPPWHELPASEVLQLLATTLSGLDLGQVQERMSLCDEPVDRAPTLWRSVMEELANPLTPILAGGAAASAAVGGAADAALVAGVTGVNALVGGVQRYHAERAIRSLARVSAVPVRSMRAGRQVIVDAGDLVPGDIVVVAAGDGVPADCRVLETGHLEVDESSVTGESIPVAKTAEPCFASVIAERGCMLYEGTSIAAGRGTAVVVATGADTETGRSRELARGRRPPGGVERRLGQLSALTIPVVVGGGTAVTVAGLLHGRPLEAGIASGVSLAVAAVPEGLPILTTMAQLAAARRLSGRGALVRDPRAIEALGRVDVLCTDKTGTLTEGRIRLHRISDGAGDISADGPLGDRHRLVLAAALRASPQARHRELLAHLTDRAVVEGARKARVHLDEGRPGWRRISELPFEPARGFHATIGRAEEGAWLSVKGAPETVLPRCASWGHPQQERTIDKAISTRLGREVEGLARQGLRILAVAERRHDVDGDPGGGSLEDDVVAQLTLLGFVVLSDPVRASAAGAVATLKRAGVRVVMVTGDHPSTAASIAAELDILDNGRVITGGELSTLDDSHLDALLPRVSVVARVTPADKVRVVAAFQRAGRSVAMTGDGANDAPAIRMADVGVALGAASTPAARGAADIIITDDRIETIVEAIVEGRAMWTSVREALGILLGGNLGEVGFTVATSILSGTAALSPRQLLLVNLLTDVAPALAIALRPPADRSADSLLLEGPDASLGRALEEAILRRAVATAGGAGAAWLVALATGSGERASTTALVALVGSQLGQTLAIGARDPLVIVAGLGSAALLAVIVQIPVLSEFFGCTPLGPLDWFIAAASAAGATGLAMASESVLPRTRGAASGVDGSSETVRRGS